MHRIHTLIVGAISLALSFVSSTAYAMDPSAIFGPITGSGSGGSSPTPPASVPELDPGTAALAIALLAAVALVVYGARKRTT